MTALSEMGAVIAPPVPAFYAKPQTLAEVIDQTLGRILDLFDLETGLVRRWGERSVQGAYPLRSKPRSGKA
jgi:4-hydroxy-3-polyprenylbenzoate decarboxylase